ncbi:BQ2448_7086 [Microbotryum intermedium]|uniref:BQ2448_7086 protein n=1 Tax=Microbotryum intermedium TaxID=269621 RepID=A0A238FLX8_9BASI|nr:BQ2448_7086 [Microbotryum intermedium]
MVDGSAATLPRQDPNLDRLGHSRIPIDISSSPWHYVLLEVTPSSLTPASSLPVDAVTLHQLVLKTMGEWYGSVGGSTTKFDVLDLSPSTEHEPGGVGGNVRLGTMRVDTSSAHHLISSIPFASFKSKSSDSDLPSYQVHVLAHSGDLSKVVKQMQKRQQKMPWE